MSDDRAFYAHQMVLGPNRVIILFTPVCGMKPTLLAHRNPVDLNTGALPRWQLPNAVVRHGCSLR
jgi:hypothetical protein